MRIELATPEVLVEVYDLPDVDITASDAAIVDAVAPLAPVSAEWRRQGAPFVLSRELEDLEAIADALAAGRQALDAAREFVCGAGSEGVSEHELARRFGVDRQTIRRWRGKGRAA